MVRHGKACDGMVRACVRGCTATGVTEDQVIDEIGEMWRRSSNCLPYERFSNDISYMPYEKKIQIHIQCKKKSLNGAWKGTFLDI